MIYELRIYHCVTGRLPALLKRFETTTLELWKRHGIRQAGFWTVLVGEGGNQDLHYLLAWESLAERGAKWNKFTADPEWLAKRAESERDGPIIASIKNMFLQPTAFEALIASDFAPLQGFVLTMAVMYVVLNLLIDVLYGLIDPRVRIEA